MSATTLPSLSLHCMPTVCGQFDVVTVTWCDEDSPKEFSIELIISLFLVLKLGIVLLPSQPFSCLSAHAHARAHSGQTSLQQVNGHTGWQSRHSGGGASPLSGCGQSRRTVAVCSPQRGRVPFTQCHATSGSVAPKQTHRSGRRYCKHVCGSAHCAYTHGPLSCKVTRQGNLCSCEAQLRFLLLH